MHSSTLSYPHNSNTFCRSVFLWVVRKKPKHVCLCRAFARAELRRFVFRFLLCFRRFMIVTSELQAKLHSKSWENYQLVSFYLAFLDNYDRQRQLTLETVNLKKESNLDDDTIETSKELKGKVRCLLNAVICLQNWIAYDFNHIICTLTRRGEDF